MSKEGILPVEILRVERSILPKKIERSDASLRHSIFDLSEFLFRSDRPFFDRRPG
jgi:hypothetical protein